jgi:hypothetical protein
MRSRVVAVLVLTTGLASGTSLVRGPAARADASSPGGLGEPSRDLARPQLRTERIWIDPARDLAADARSAHLSHLLFVNRCPGGCTVNPGTNDARANSSSVVSRFGSVPRTFTEFELGDEIFDAVIACVRDVYAPYDVQVVTEDPDSTLHHEAILAGFAEEMGYPAESRVGGVAPAFCDPANNVISFSFANEMGRIYSGDRLVEQLCWTVAQESAHAFGLPNHVYDCLDPLTYLDGNCGRKYFRDQDSECAEIDDQGIFTAGPCLYCDIGRQNSHAALLESFGPSSTPLPPPEVNLFYPADGATGLPDKFTFGFSATDPRLISHADLYINGSKYLTLPGKEYATRNEAYAGTVPDHPDGYMDLEVKAYSGIGVEGTAVVTVLKGQPCSSADQCFAHMSCQEGRCVYPAPSGQLGDACDYDQYCLSNLCAQYEGGSICTQTCSPDVTGGCPEGFECVQGGFCWDPSASGGCCTVAGGHERDQRFPLVVLSLFAAGVWILRRRRPRGDVGSPAARTDRTA